MTYRIQFSGLSESRVRTACGGMVGGDARVLNVWGAGNSDMTADIEIDADREAQLRDELEGDDRVTTYAAV